MSAPYLIIVLQTREELFFNDPLNDLLITANKL
jgi:hypothetical protein